MKTPFQQVTSEHGGKDKLVDKVASLVESVVGRGEASKEDLRKRLQSVANSQLQRLEQTLRQISSSFGTKEKLVDALLALLKRTKDADYRRSLLARTPGYLLDLVRSVERRVKRQAA